MYSRTKDFDAVLRARSKEKAAAAAAANGNGTVRVPASGTASRRRETAFLCCLAPGLLTGKHARPTAGGEEGSGVLPGRFRENPNYLPRFYTAANFEALALIEAGLPTGVRGQR